MHRVSKYLPVLMLYFQVLASGPGMLGHVSLRLRVLLVVVTPLRPYYIFYKFNDCLLLWVQSTQLLHRLWLQGSLQGQATPLPQTRHATEEGVVSHAWVAKAPSHLPSRNGLHDEVSHSPWLRSFQKCDRASQQDTPALRGAPRVEGSPGKGAAVGHWQACPARVEV